MTIPTIPHSWQFVQVWIMAQVSKWTTKRNWKQGHIHDANLPESLNLFVQKDDRHAIMCCWDLSPPKKQHTHPLMAIFMPTNVMSCNVSPWDLLGNPNRWPGSETLGTAELRSLSDHWWTVQCCGSFVAASWDQSCVLCGQPNCCIQPAFAAETWHYACGELHGQHAQLPWGQQFHPLSSLRHLPIPSTSKDRCGCGSLRASHVGLCGFGAQCLFKRPWLSYLVGSRRLGLLVWMNWSSLWIWLVRHSSEIACTISPFMVGFI